MGQYFSNEKLKSNITKYNKRILEHTFTFNTDNGVFSKNKLDFGTRLLLETIPIEKLSGNILDVGTGYGVIPIVLSKFVNGNFTGVDVNKRAIHLANITIKENNCDNITFIESDCYKNITDKYDFIITNPPIRAGKEIVYEIVMNAKDYLKKNGALFIVIRKD